MNRNSQWKEAVLNEKFLKLPEEKQRKIIYSAVRVFAELEIVRDCENNMITVCFIENIDPLGVHTGDSFCSAPMLTISEECQKRLQEQAYKIVESVQVIGGTNVQFAHDPETDRIVVIEINPRTSHPHSTHPLRFSSFPSASLKSAR